ncbi:MAG: glycosyltransferase [Janthinobacterium lividum]
MAPRLRIMVYLHSFEPGGVERVALRLAEAWQAGGADVRVVMGRPDGPQRDLAPGLQYRFLRDEPGRGGSFETLRMIARLPREIAAVRPDVLFCAGNTYSIVALVVRVWLGRQCPPILGKVSNDLDRPDLGLVRRSIRSVWHRLVGRTIDHFVGMAKPAGTEIASAMKIDRSRISIVNDPAVTLAEIARGASFRRSRPVGPGRRFVGVGRLVRQKNFALLIKAFARIAGPDDRLLIAGEGPLRADLEQLAADCGVADRVELPGHIDVLEPWLAASDVFVLSSIFEGVPAVIVEALVAGLPIVATDCSVSMRTMLDDGALGRLVPLGDAAALAQAMTQARHLAPAVERARARATTFTLDHAAEAYLSVMHRTIADVIGTGRRAVTADARYGSPVFAALPSSLPTTDTLHCATLVD